MTEPHASSAAQDGGALEETSRGELIALLEKRAAIYGLLSRLYLRELDEPFLEKLREGRFPARTGNDRVDEGYRLIARYLSGLHSGSLELLAQDYTRCFVGEGLDLFSAAYPYESVHTSSKRLLMQSALDEVVAIMDSEGVAKRGEWKETEDHIACELEFMQALSRRTAKALESGDEDEAARLLEVQRNFHDDHLAAWVPLLTAELRKFAQTDFYRGLAELTDGFLQEDGEFLEGAIEDGA